MHDVVDALAEWPSYRGKLELAAQRPVLSGLACSWCLAWLEHENAISRAFNFENEIEQEMHVQLNNLGMSLLMQSHEM